MLDLAILSLANLLWLLATGSNITFGQSHSIQQPPSVEIQFPIRPLVLSSRLMMFLPSRHFKLYELQETMVEMYWPFYLRPRGYGKHETMFMLWDILTRLRCVFKYHEIRWQDRCKITMCRWLVLDCEKTVDGY